MSLTSEECENSTMSEFETIDNSKSMGERIYSTLHDQIMTDICLEVNGVEYPCHRLFLGISSDVFKAMLMQDNWSETYSQQITLHENPACYKAFPAFLRYFYTHKIEISIDNVMPIIILADKYMVKELLSSCVQYLVNHTAQATLLGRIVPWIEYAYSRSHDDDVAEVTRFVCHNFELFMNNTPLSLIPLDILLWLLKSSDLVVLDEQTLFNWVVKWLQQYQKTEPNDLERVVQLLLKNIRFSMLTPHQLAELLLNPFCKEFTEIFVPRMTLGMAFHKGVKSQIQESLMTPEACLQFLPRLYTTNSHSTLLTIENIKLLPAYHTSTLVFSSHAVSDEYEDRDRLCEWVVDVYPKGVWIKKCLLINWQGTIEVPDHVLRTVRLSIFCKDPPSNPESELRVMIGILVYGQQNGIEHIKRVVKRIYNFSQTDRVLHIDNLVPFTEWNDSAKVHFQSEDQSFYLVGPENDVFKLRIIVSSLCRPSDLRCDI